MLGRRTALVLGAGASYCYEDGGSSIPIQANIIGRLFFGGDTGGGEGFPSFSGPSGPRHSFALGQYLRAKFDIPEDPKKKMSKLDFWTILQERGYNLESLYGELESDLAAGDQWLLDEFKAIIRTAVLEPVRDREIARVCRYHRMICEWLEPGDYIINFNWDSLMADALLYYSHFWFPMTGFGFSPVRPLMKRSQKAIPAESLVDLFHIHGSVLLFELEEPPAPGTRSILYLGAAQYDPLTVFLQLEGADLGSMQKGSSNSVPARPENEEAGQRLLAFGHILLQGKWYKPIFVAPGKEKGEYRDWYFRGMKRFIHSRLPMTEQVIIAGYSFPDADYEYTRSIFVSEIIPEKARIQVVNPANGEESFQARVKAVFWNQEEVAFSLGDFREFCSSLGSTLSKPPS